MKRRGWANSPLSRVVEHVVGSVSQEGAQQTIEVGGSAFQRGFDRPRPLSDPLPFPPPR